MPAESRCETFFSASPKPHPKDPAVPKTLRGSELLRRSVFTTPPPDLLRREPLFEGTNVCNSQENGVCTRCAAIVNHYGIVNLLRRANLLRRSIFSTAGSFGHPSKPHPCNMPQAKTEVALQFSECCAAATALQHRLFCSAEVIWTRSCAAASEKLHCNIEKAALQESGAFLPLSCGFQAPMFRHPRLGPADFFKCG